MLTIRKSDERGHANHGWLDSYHTFSFAGYYDPRHMGYRDLRVINQDWVAAGMGFGAHPHRDMEIVTYLLEGALEHKDSMGNVEVMRRGDVQRMSAGTGVVHSEYNHSQSEPVRFLQIWILPEANGLPPSYEQKHFSAEEKRNRLRLIVSRDGRDDSLHIHQDVSIYASVLDAGAAVIHEVAPNRHAWIQIARGTVTIAGQQVQAGDGIAIDTLGTYAIESLDNAELVLFDLA